MATATKISKLEICQKCEWFATQPYGGFDNIPKNYYVRCKLLKTDWTTIGEYNTCEIPENCPYILEHTLNKSNKNGFKFDAESGWWKARRKNVVIRIFNPNPSWSENTHQMVELCVKKQHKLLPSKKMAFQYPDFDAILKIACEYYKHSNILPELRAILDKK